MYKQIILIGADELGRAALNFLGANRVYCFADINYNTIDNVLDGKKIISIEQLKEIWHEYEIFVVSRNYAQIVEILAENKIEKFKKYPLAVDFNLTKFYMEEKLIQYKNIAVYGTSFFLDIFLEKINYINKNCIKYVINEDPNKCDSKKMSVPLETLEGIDGLIDCIIIANPDYHIAMENRLELFFNKKIKVLNPFKAKTYYSTDYLVINKYKNPVNEAKSEDEINKINENKGLQFEAIHKYVKEVQNNLPLFKLVEIETINRCNGICDFCPVNQHVDTRKKEIMSEAVYKKIVFELKELNYAGRISLFSNNEPLLDDRIEEFSRILRKELPNAKIHMFTNGTLFTLSKFKNLISNLDELIIDNYQQELQLIKPVREIKEYCDTHPELISKVSIVLRKPKEILTSRGGDAPNRKEKVSYPDVTCPFPFQQMIIRPTGEVSLCCNDPLGKYTMGDVSKEKILDVWYGLKYQKIREGISKGRGTIDHCRYCDVFSLYL